MRGVTDSTGSGRIRKLLLALLAVVVLGALIYRSRGLIGLEDFSWARLGRSVRQARGSLLLLSLVGIYAAYAIRALRWMRFSRHLGRPRFLNVYSATLMGFAAVFLLGRAGEPVRPLLLARKERLAVSSMFGIYVLERLFDAASTAVLAGLLPAAAFLVYFRLHGAGALERRLERWRMAEGWRRRLAGLFAGFAQGLQAIRTFSDLLAAVVY